MASAAISETNGRPQPRHIGSTIFSNPARQGSQIGMRLAFVSIWPQMRQGAGKTTDARASNVAFRITDALLTGKVRCEATPNRGAKKEQADFGAPRRHLTTGSAGPLQECQAKDSKDERGLTATPALSFPG